MRNTLDKERRKLEGAGNLLAAYSPLNVLEKGYAIIEDNSGKVLDSVGLLDETKILRITVKDGKRTFIKGEKLKQYSVADELIKWAKLKEDGHISEEEFNEARKKLLKRA